MILKFAASIEGHVLNWSCTSTRVNEVLSIPMNSSSPDGTSGKVEGPEITAGGHRSAKREQNCYSMACNNY